MKLRARPALLALVLLIVGWMTVAVGLAMVFPPAGVIFGGVGPVLAGLLLLDVGGGTPG